MPQATTETSAGAPLAPFSSGYAAVNGIKVYHEIYGQSYSHYNFVSATELAPIIDKYLADPLTNPPAGAAAASQPAPTVFAGRD